jgi:hypothetical protein
MPTLGAPEGGVFAVAVLLVGAVAALAGLWMLLRPAEGDKPGRRVAAGVFAAGALLLLVPWVHAPSEATPPPAGAGPVSIGTGLVIAPEGLRSVPLQPKPAPLPPLPGRVAATIDIEGAEAEPNDTLAAANRARIGVAIDGHLEPGDRDYFAIDVPPGTRGLLVANLMVEDTSVSLTLFDDAGQTLGTATTFEELAIRNTRIERKLDGPRYYVLVQPLGGPTPYQLTVAARPR